MAEMPRGQYVRMLSAVYAAMFLVRVAFGITIVTFASYVTADDFAYALIVTASPVAELLTVVFAGILIDRYGRKGVLMTGLGIAAIALYGLALTTNPFALAFVNALHGVAAAFILVTTLAVIATYAPEQHRGREMGIFNLANLAGWIAGFVLGEILAEIFVGRLEYTFVIAGALATLGLLYANRMLKLPTEQAARRSAPPSLRDLAASVGNKDLLLLTAPWLIVFMLVGSLITFFPRVADSLQIGAGTTGLAIIGIGVLFLVSQVFWGRLADRKGREAIMLTGAVGFALLMGIIMFGFFESPDHIVTEAVESFDVGTTAGATATVPMLGIMAAGPAPTDPGHPIPEVDATVPSGGPPGTAVRLQGRGFGNVTRVTFNGHESAFDVNENGTELTTTVPPDATTGPLALHSPTPPQVVFQSVMSHGWLLAIALFLALAFAPAGLAAIADEAKEGAQGTTMSAYSLTLSLGFIVGPPILGFVSENYGGPGMVIFFAVLAAALLAMVFTHFIQNRHAPRRGHHP